MASLNTQTLGGDSSREPEAKTTVGYRPWEAGGHRSLERSWERLPILPRVSRRSQPGRRTPSLCNHERSVSAV